MKQKNVDALKIGGVVTLLVGAGLGVFLFSGSVESVVFAAVGIPTGLLIYGVYYRRQHSTTKSSTSSRLQSMAEDVATELGELLRTHDQLSDVGGWNPIEIENEIRDLQQTVENRGFVVDRDRRQVVVEDVDMGLGALDNYKTEIRDVKQRLVSEFADHLEGEVEMMAAQIDRLVEADLLSENMSFETGTQQFHTADENTLRERFDERRNEFLEGARQAAERIESQAGHRSAVDSEQVRNAVAEGEYERAADMVLNARTAVEDQTRGEFESRREQLLGLQKTVLESDGRNFATSEEFETVGASKTAVENLDSVFDSGELDAEWQRTRRAGLEVVASLENALAERIEEIERGDVPRDFSEERALVDRRNRSQLEQADSPTAFESRWTQRTDDLIDAIDRVAIYTEAIRAYSEVESTIDRRIDAEGEVRGADIPYDPPEPIMELYEAKNSGVRYLSSQSLLTVVSGRTETATETEPEAEFDLRVTVESSGSTTPGEMTVVVDGSPSADRRSATITEPGELTFGPLPAAEYTVKVTPSSEAHRGAETDVFLNKKESVTLVVSEVGPVERVCNSLESETRPLLREVGSILEDRFQEIGYLDTAVDLPVQEQYQPCLLVLWADEQGLAIREQAGESVLVYDREKTMKRLENLIEHKLDQGDSLTYDEISESYLSVPADATLIHDVLEHSPVSEELRFDDDQVVKV